MAVRFAQMFRKASPSCKHEGKDQELIRLNATEAGKCSPSASIRHFTEVTYFSEVKEAE